MKIPSLQLWIIGKLQGTTLQPIFYKIFPKSRWLLRKLLKVYRFFTKPTSRKHLRKTRDHLQSRKDETNFLFLKLLEANTSISQSVNQNASFVFLPVFSIGSKNNFNLKSLLAISYAFKRMKNNKILVDSEFEVQ